MSPGRHRFRQQRHEHIRDEPSLISAGQDRENIFTVIAETLLPTGTRAGKRKSFICHGSRGRDDSAQARQVSLQNPLGGRVLEPHPPKPERPMTEAILPT